MRKWKPSAAAKKEFAQRMANDAEYAAAYYKRQQNKTDKKRKTSQFDYPTAGGMYVPTKAQYDGAFSLLNDNPTPQQMEGANMVIYGYNCKEKVHHDNIHIVNEYIRSKSI
jgi:hypothetical protein